jgi:hypothetical protein
MGEYFKKYIPQWLHINPLKKTITTKYTVEVYLGGTQETAKLPDLESIIENEFYDNIYNLPIIVFGISTTFGDLQLYLSQCDCKCKDNEFIIDEKYVSKFGNIGLSIM